VHNKDDQDLRSAPAEKDVLKHPYPLKELYLKVVRYRRELQGCYKQFASL